MQVQAIMTKKVFTLRADKRVFIAKQIMGWAHVRHIPVVDRLQRLVGLVSHRDLLAASISTQASKVAALERGQHLAGIPVREIMQQQVKTIGPLASAHEAAQLMREHKIGCLPVLDDERHLVGIVTTHDLLELV